MTSLVIRQGDSSTELASRLAVLPSLVGAATVAIALAGGFLVGVADSETGLILLWVGTAFIALAMAAGFVVGHYLGLLALVIGTLLPAETDTSAAAELAEASSPGPSFTTLALTSIWLLAVHEGGRLSLDARRPSRFAPGLLRRYLLTTVTVAVGLLALAGAYTAVRSWALPAGLVPLGLSTVALPLLIRRWVQGMPLSWRSVATVRLGVAVLAIALAFGAVLTGAQARSGIVNERVPGASSPTEPSTEEPDEAATDPTEEIVVNEVGRAITIGVAVIAIIVAGLLYAAFRRPEQAFELDELQMDIDERSMGLAGSGQADLDDQQTVIDEREIEDLLGELRLDLMAEPDPGRAVRFGYTTIERRLNELGVERQDHETEQELLARALPVLADSSSLVALTRLFEVARFSHEPVTEAMRQDAVAAIDRLRRETATP